MFQKRQIKTIFKPEELYFTSDWHLGHDAMLTFKHKSGRQLRTFSSPDEMNQTIIDNMNAIPEDSHLFLLGDVAMGNRKRAFALIDQIKCKNIYLIKGNHDRKIAEQIPARWIWVKDYFKLSVEDPEAVSKRNNGIQDICLFHYPITSWEKAIHGTWHLYGHCHGNLDEYFWTDEKMVAFGKIVNGENSEKYSDCKSIEEKFIRFKELSEKQGVKSFDIGVDCHDYKPVSYQQVKEAMQSRKLPYNNPNYIDGKKI